MDKIAAVLNPTTVKWVEAFTNRPSSTLLIESSDAAVSDYIVERIHSSLIGDSSNPILWLRKAGASVSIDEVRALQSNLHHKANIKTEKPVSRMAVICDAETMSIEAQNAVLKLLEELPEKTIVVLLANSTEVLLETLRSRCFKISVLPPKKEQLSASFPDASPNEIDQAVLISNGNYSNVLAILSNDYEHATLEFAKKFLTGSVYERQILLAEFHKKTPDYKSLLQSLKLLAQTGMQAAKTTSRKIGWKTRLQAILCASDQLDHNVSPKLVLLSLSVEL